MAGRLAQAQQRFEHCIFDLADARRARPRRAASRGSGRAARRRARAASGRQLAVDRLLGSRRQLARHLLLGAAQDERPQRAREQRGRLAVRGRAPDAAQLEHRERAEHARVEELEQAPELAEVVLDRRAGERQAMAAAQQARRLRRRRARVLDRLRLVEDDVVERRCPCNGATSRRSVP